MMRMPPDVLLVTLRVLWSYRHARARAWLMPLRAIAALLVVGFLVEPAVQLRAVRKIKNRLAVVVDRSRSMGLDTVSGQSTLAGRQRQDVWLTNK